MKTLTKTETAACQSVWNLVTDGIWGPKTQAAFEQWAGISPSIVIKSDLYEHAKKDLGMHEVPGPGSHSRILQAISEAGEWLVQDDSKTAWCGCILGLWCKETGKQRPKEWFRAANWLNIGEPVQLKDAQRGDVCVFTRSGGNHVALFSSYSNGRISILGGNQSDAVTITSMPESTLRGIRRL